VENPEVQSFRAIVLPMKLKPIILPSNLDSYRKIRKALPPAGRTLATRKGTGSYNRNRAKQDVRKEMF
jgi:hypothetical protein